MAKTDREVSVIALTAYDDAVAAVEHAIEVCEAAVDSVRDPHAKRIQRHLDRLQLAERQL